MSRQDPVHSLGSNRQLQLKRQSGSSRIQPWYASPSKFEAGLPLQERGLTLPSSGRAFGTPLKSNVRQTLMTNSSITETREKKKKLKPIEQIVACLPIGLVVIGGLIGGAIGGGAYGINVSIFKRELPTPKKYAYSILVSLAACALYFVVAVAIALVFPGLTKK